MGEYADKAWYQEGLEVYLDQYGSVPPPWVFAEDSHPMSMRWRMGAGETYLMVFFEWWGQEDRTEAERVAYFKKWPPPPRWLEWTAEVIWDLEPWDSDDDFDFKPYFEKLDDLGFDGVSEFEQDFHDEQWS